MTSVAPERHASFKNALHFYFSCAKTQREMVKHNRQHVPRAATLRRIAKGYRLDAKDYRRAGNPAFAELLTKQAKRFDAEAKLLGELR